MKWFALSLGLLLILGTSGCWRPYYGRRFGQPAYAQPNVAPPALAQPTYSQPVVQQGAPVATAQPQVIQAAPAVQTYQPYQQPCVPCTPNPCCVPCY